MKKYIYRIVFFLLLVGAYSLYRFVTVPDVVRIISAASATCDIPEQYREDNLKYRIELLYAKIYRTYLMRFGTKEILDDGSLAISFLPISFNAYDGLCRASSIRLFERLVVKGCDINTSGNYQALGPNVKLTIFHDAIMLEEDDLVEYLLHNGADPSVKTQLPGTKADGMNSIELASLVNEKKNSLASNHIVKLLKEKSNKAL